MDLIQYNNKNVSLIDIDGDTWIGTAHYCDADTSGTLEDVLVLKVESEYIEIMKSEIKSIKVI